jgi:Xaa-Pro aminopeptidase
MAGEIEQQLVDAAWPYWEAEGEIAKRFFAKASADDHVFYLRAQLWKELNPVDGFFNGLHRELARLVEIYPRVDKDIDRHDYHFLLLQLAQEFNHYVLLADIYEHLVDRKISPGDTVQLPEEKKLGDLRRGYVQSGSPIDRAAVGLTEGGGARLFREGAKLSGGKLAEMTARAMQTIYDDEKDHYLEQAREAVRLIKSAADLDRMKAAIRAISRQRVKMRQEMFRGAMTDGEIEAFLAANRREAA